MVSIIRIVRENLLRIAEILSVLKFAPTMEDYAERFLGMDSSQLRDFLAGRISYVSTVATRHLRQQLDIAHNTGADEVARSTDKNELWTAQSRYNLIQIANIHLDEIDEKLSWRMF